ncbi:MAG: 50S ribosomal protein L3 [Bacillota bacterium]
MEKGILGLKRGMTQVFDKAGRLVAVTVVEAGPCVVVQKKTVTKDGYNALQLGMVPVAEKKLNKPLRGHFARAGVKPMRFLREVRLDDISGYEVGQEVRVDIFKDGERVDVTGTRKGHGFAGGVKRWGFHRGPMAHGSKYHRRVGSLQSRAAARVFKGRKMPGHYGADRFTVQNLEVVKVDPTRNLLLLKGSVPGPKGSLVIVKDAAKK